MCFVPAWANADPKPISFALQQMGFASKLMSFGKNAEKTAF